MFLPDQFTGLAAQALPVATKRAEYYVLNLFCGRRRPEDIQACLEWRHYDVDLTVTVLSIDIAIDP
eukprot:1092125-Pyramimonas_sp.AAC.1